MSWGSWGAVGGGSPCVDYSEHAGRIAFDVLRTNVSTSIASTFVRP
jgi:hypothetical protein